MANHNPSPATRFQAGEAWRGNAQGRPPGRSLTAKLRDMLSANTLDGRELPEGQTVADVVAAVILQRALGGDFRFMVALLDRTEGRVRDRAQEPAEVPMLSLQWETVIEQVYGNRPASQELESN